MIAPTVAAFALLAGSAAAFTGSDDRGTTIPLTLEPVFPRLGFPPPVMLREDTASGRFFLLALNGQLFSFPAVDDPDPQDMALVLDISSKLGTASTDQGSYCFAFDPEFATNNRVFVNYASNESNRLAISQFTLGGSPTEASLTEVPLILADPPSGFLHYGGSLEFGADGYLYISTGDGNAGIPSQEPGSFLGKILRIDVSSGTDYTVPTDNPFFGLEGWLPEIWALGLRNPYRFSFDEPTGRLFVGDPGEDYAEEVNIIGKGGNYGWPYREADQCFEESPQCDRVDLLEPIYVYNPPGPQALLGGFVYRGSGIPALTGTYVFADFFGKVVGLELDGDNVTGELALANTGGGLLSGISRDADGELYVLSFPTGGIKRLTGASSVSPIAQVGGLLGNGEVVDLNMDDVDDSADVHEAVRRQ